MMEPSHEYGFKTPYPALSIYPSNHFNRQAAQISEPHGVLSSNNSRNIDYEAVVIRKFILKVLGFAKLLSSKLYFFSSMHLTPS